MSDLPYGEFSREGLIDMLEEATERMTAAETRVQEFETVKAEQQITGFYHAAQGFDIVSLVQAMGLKSEEWHRLKISMPWLGEKFVREIDTYFEGEEA